MLADDKEWEAKELLLEKIREKHDPAARDPLTRAYAKEDDETTKGHVRAALLELEGAFRLFVALRPDEARAACSRLAQKSRDQDRDLYKLAVLAEAWIAELSGDPARAAEVLEQLGNERGFAGDTDRALALVRVYELLGRTEDLEKAIHVCEYLLRTLRSFERVIALGRLAVLCRTAGRQADVSVLDVRQGNWVVYDVLGEALAVDTCVVPVLTLKRGRVFEPEWGPRPWGWEPEPATL